MITLQDFVTETLVQVIEGVKSAQEKTVSSGAMINPMGMEFSGKELFYEETRTNHYGQMVDFDVAVVASEDKGLKGGITVPTLIGYEAKKDNSNSFISRVKFSIPVFLPRQKPQPPQEK